MVWLTGVRRIGKTTLAREIADAEYFNCDLPSATQRMADPEAFFRSLERPRVILDEVHQLADPSTLLKVGTDHFPRLRILATGSSTLASTAKFRDSLTGRKRVVHLQPVLYEELAAFGVRNLQTRLLRGGLPQLLLGDELDREAYAEWLDSYYARDVQELFRLGKRASFLRLLELVLRQSGKLAEGTSLAKHASVTRPTVMSWLDVFQITNVVTIVRPFSGGGRREILAQPKIYGFDTGFVAHFRGWDALRAEDCGDLWEHVVLETLLASGARPIHFWRDKQQREVDFVLPSGRDRCDVIECKWSASAFEPRGFLAFREHYPKGNNFVVVPTDAKPLERTAAGLDVTFLSPAELGRRIAATATG